MQEFQINYNLTKNLKIQRFETDDSHSIAHHDCFVSKQGCAIEITNYDFFFVISKYSMSKQGVFYTFLKIKYDRHYGLGHNYHFFIAVKFARKAYCKGSNRVLRFTTVCICTKL